MSNPAAGPRSVQFLVPLPPAECSPNARAHWAQKARAVARYRLDVALCLYEACGGPSKVPYFKQAVIHLEYRFTRTGRRDGDNLWARGKQIQDACVDAGLLPDDDLCHLTPGTVTACKGTRPGVLVRVEERTNG